MHVRQQLFGVGLRIAWRCLSVVILAGATIGLPAAAGLSDSSATLPSAGPQAAARVDARVTRIVDGTPVTLPGAVVPALANGDVVDIRFPDFSPPLARAQYHVNAAFITEAAPQHWLFERSNPADRLFATTARHAVTASPGGLHFTYGGSPGQRGIPIFFIVPEDGKTRGMDGVRDYVDAHPTDFVDMAQSADEAAERYIWFRDFLLSLSNGSIDPVSARQRVTSIASSLGANPTAIEACYATGGTNASVTDCIKTTLDALNFQTNIDAPTQAQFFGGAAGAVAPVAIATYLVPLLGVWKLFVHTGHREYEYLPSTLTGSTTEREVLAGIKVASLRPPAAYSDALFFTIGDPQAAAAPPSAVNASDPNGTCISATRFAVPLHLDRTSGFVHDTRLRVTPDGARPYDMVIDPRSIDAPSLSAAQLAGATDGAYMLDLAGRFGFDPIRQPAVSRVRVVVPQAANWSLAALPHRPAITGDAFDYIATSAAAPCLTRAEIQIGDAPPLPLDFKRLSDRRLALHASLANVPAGDAQVRLYQADMVHDTEIENDVAVRIGAKPAQVEAAIAPVAYLGDRFIALSGSELQSAASVRIDGKSYAEIGDSNAREACFSGPPLVGPGLVPGESVSAQFIGRSGLPGAVFPLTIGARRPAIQLAEAASTVHLSSIPFTVILNLSAAAVPAQPEIRLRQRPAGDASPCAAIQSGDAAFAILQPDASRVLSDSNLSVTFDAALRLNDRAFGMLQLQLVDTHAHAASDWLTLPGTFVRAPHVAAVECHTDAAAPCALRGTGLETIAGLDDGNGGIVTLGPPCAHPAHEACLELPHRPTFVLRLVDGNTAMPIATSLVTNGPGRPSPAPAPAQTSSPAAAASPAAVVPP